MSNKNVVNTNQSHSIAAKGFFFLMFIWMPFYFDKNFYFAMIEAKSNAYAIAAVVMYVAIAIAFLASLHYHTKKKKWENPLKNVSFLDWAVVGFVVVVIVSFLLSGDLKACWVGYNGFFVGAYMILSSFLFFFYVSRFLNEKLVLWRWVFVADTCLLLWVFLNSVSVDLFGMHAGLDSVNYFHYFA